MCQPAAPALLLLLLLAALPASPAPMHEQVQHQLDEYYGSSASGCYYNFVHYEEGDRILTNEPCLNCTCHNRMLMCYLRVCPFSKGIGQDCTVEQKPDQCCPVITCPEVPVQLVTSSTTVTTPPAPTGSTAVGHPDNYGCTIDEVFYADGTKIPGDPSKPCELCYCIRNHTACVMQECTLHVEGCRPVYTEGVCCPVRYDCDYQDYTTSAPFLETTVRPTPGLVLTTTLAGPLDCRYNDQTYADGALIKTAEPCQHCYCMRGDIVCAVQECGTPLEREAGNCTALPPQPGQCCPQQYQCDNATDQLEILSQEKDTIQNTSVSQPGTPISTHQENPPVTEATIQQQHNVQVSSPEDSHHFNEIDHGLDEQIHYDDEEHNDKDTEIEHITQAVDHESGILQVTDTEHLPSEGEHEGSSLVTETFIETSSKQETTLGAISASTEKDNQNHQHISDGTQAATEDNLQEADISNQGGITQEPLSPSILTVKPVELSGISTTEQDHIVLPVETDFQESTLIQDYEEQSQMTTSKSSDLQTESHLTTLSEIQEVVTVNKTKDGHMTETTIDEMATIKDETGIGTETNEIDIPVTMPSEIQKLTDAHEPITSMTSETEVSDESSTSLPHFSRPVELNEIFNTTGQAEEATQANKGVIPDVSIQKQESANNFVSSVILAEIDESTEGNQESITAEGQSFITTEDNVVPSVTTIPLQSEKSEAEVSVVPAEVSESTTEVHKDNHISPVEVSSGTMSEGNVAEVVDRLEYTTTTDVIKQQETASNDINFTNTSTVSQAGDISQQEIEPSAENDGTFEVLPTEANTAEQETVLPDETQSTNKIDLIEPESTTKLTELPAGGIVSESGNTFHPAAFPSIVDHTTDITKEQEPATNSPAPGSIHSSDKDSDINTHTTESILHGSLDEESVTTMETGKQKHPIIIPAIVQPSTESDRYAEIPSEISEGVTASAVNVDDFAEAEADHNQPTLVHSDDLMTTNTGDSESYTTEISFVSKPSDGSTVINEQEASNEGQESNESLHHELVTTSSYTNDDKEELSVTSSEIQLPGISEKTEAEKMTLASVDKNNIYNSESTNSITDGSVYHVPGEVNNKPTEVYATMSDSMTTSPPPAEISNSDEETKQTRKPIITENSNKEIVPQKPTEANNESNVPVTTPGIDSLDKETMKPQKPIDKVDVAEPTVSVTPGVAEQAGPENEKPLTADVQGIKHENNIGTSSGNQESPEDVTESMTHLTTKGISDVIYDTSNQQEINKPVNTENQKIPTESSTMIAPGASTLVQDIAALHESQKPNEIDSFSAEGTGGFIHELSTAPTVVGPLGVTTTELMHGVIPGEGSCLVDGQTYVNNSEIPPPSPCHVACRCISSIVHCVSVSCPPPPAHLENCTPIRHSGDACCPTYTCDVEHKVTLVADNQMAGTEVPVESNETPTGINGGQQENVEPQHVEESSSVPEHFEPAEDHLQSGQSTEGSLHFTLEPSEHKEPTEAEEADSIVENSTDHSFIPDESEGEAHQTSHPVEFSNQATDQYPPNQPGVSEHHDGGIIMHTDMLATSQPSTIIEHDVEVSHVNEVQSTMSTDQPELVRGDSPTSEISIDKTENQVVVSHVTSSPEYSASETTDFVEKDTNVISTEHSDELNIGKTQGSTLSVEYATTSVIETDQQYSTSVQIDGDLMTQFSSVPNQQATVTASDSATHIRATTQSTTDFEEAANADGSVLQPNITSAEHFPESSEADTTGSILVEPTPESILQETGDKKPEEPSDIIHADVPSVAPPEADSHSKDHSKDSNGQVNPTTNDTSEEQLSSEEDSVEQIQSIVTPKPSSSVGTTIKQPQKGEEHAYPEVTTPVEHETLHLEGESQQSVSPQQPLPAEDEEFIEGSALDSQQPLPTTEQAFTADDTEAQQTISPEHFFPDTEVKIDYPPETPVVDVEGQTTVLQQPSKEKYDNESEKHPNTIHDSLETNINETDSDSNLEDQHTSEPANFDQAVSSTPQKHEEQAVIEEGSGETTDTVQPPFIPSTEQEAAVDNSEEQIVVATTTVEELPEHQPTLLGTIHPQEVESNGMVVTDTLEPQTAFPVEIDSNQNLTSDTAGELETQTAILPEESDSHQIQELQKPVLVLGDNNVTEGLSDKHTTLRPESEIDQTTTSLVEADIQEIQGSHQLSEDMGSTQGSVLLTSPNINSQHSLVDSDLNFPDKEPGKSSTMLPGNIVQETEIPPNEEEKFSDSQTPITEGAFVQQSPTTKPHFSVPDESNNVYTPEQQTEYPADSHQETLPQHLSHTDQEVNITEGSGEHNLQTIINDGSGGEQTTVSQGASDNQKPVSEVQQQAVNAEFDDTVKYEEGSGQQHITEESVQDIPSSEESNEQNIIVTSHPDTDITGGSVQQETLSSTEPDGQPTTSPQNFEGSVVQHNITSNEADVKQTVAPSDITQHQEEYQTTSPTEANAQQTVAVAQLYPSPAADDAEDTKFDVEQNTVVGEPAYVTEGQGDSQGTTVPVISSNDVDANDGLGEDQRTISPEATQQQTSTTGQSMDLEDGDNIVQKPGEQQPVESIDFTTQPSAPISELSVVEHDKVQENVLPGQQPQVQTGEVITTGHDEGQIIISDTQQTVLPVQLPGTQETAFTAESDQQHTDMPEETSSTEIVYPEKSPINEQAESVEGVTEKPISLPADTDHQQNAPSESVTHIEEVLEQQTEFSVVTEVQQEEESHGTDFGEHQPEPSLIEDSPTTVSADVDSLLTTNIVSSLEHSTTSNRETSESVLGTSAVAPQTDHLVELTNVSDVSPDTSKKPVASSDVHVTNVTQITPISTQTISHVTLPLHQPSLTDIESADHKTELSVQTPIESITAEAFNHQDVTTSSSLTSTSVLPSKEIITEQEEIHITSTHDYGSSIHHSSHRPIFSTPGFPDLAEQNHVHVEQTNESEQQPSSPHPSSQYPFYSSSAAPPNEHFTESHAVIPGEGIEHITGETNDPTSHFTTKPAFTTGSHHQTSQHPEDQYEHFPFGEGQYPTGAETDYDEEEQAAFGPGTCRYGGKVYVSAQQIPRDDPCDFCFCFRSDIICLQQSCPPPIPGCHEEPIQGFCCPRYECPVSMATMVNVSTTTTTTTTTLPPHFLSHAYKGAARRTGCHVQGSAYRVGEMIHSASGPCLECRCGGDGQMKCEPKECSPEPMLRKMIMAAASRRR